MPTENITYFSPGSFERGYHSSIFNDNKMSDKVRDLMKPVWGAEDRMRLEMANRINVILRDRKEPLEFDFSNTLRIMLRFKCYTVVGIQSVSPPHCTRDKTALRRLEIILERDGRRTVSDVLYSCGLNELITLYEMILRALWPREDHPDRSGYCPFK